MPLAFNIRKTLSSISVWFVFSNLAWAVIDSANSIIALVEFFAVRLDCNVSIRDAESMPAKAPPPLYRSTASKRTPIESSDLNDAWAKRDYVYRVCAQKDSMPVVTSAAVGHDFGSCESMENQKCVYWWNLFLLRDSQMPLCPADVYGSLPIVLSVGTAEDNKKLLSSNRNVSHSFTQDLHSLTFQHQQYYLDYGPNQDLWW